MYLPLARSPSKFIRTFSSSPTLAGVPFVQPFVGQGMLGRALVFCAYAAAVTGSEMHNMRRRILDDRRTEVDMTPLPLRVLWAAQYCKTRLAIRVVAPHSSNNRKL